MRLGIAHHLGWAVAVTATDEGTVVDRRRIELIEPDLPVAPIHHEGGPHLLHRTGPALGDDELAELVRVVRGAVVRAIDVALDLLVDATGGSIRSLSVRAWADDFPVDVATQRRVPYESRADSVMYCQVLAGAARRRGWHVHRFDAKNVEAEAAALLGVRAREVLYGPRATLGSPWTKDHRTALAATVVATGADDDR